MPIPQVAGTSTATVKVPQLNDTISAINADLAALGARLDALEGRPDLVTRVEALEAEPDLTARLEAAEALLAAPGPVPGMDALVARIEAAEAALAILQTTPHPTTPPVPVTMDTSSALPRPEGVDPGEVTLVYDKATLYYGDMALHAIRLDDRRWRLLARLNYIVLASTDWTYDEVVEGTPDEIYAHAQRRLMELAELKPKHDEVHERVVAMSEGR
jgi:hypothetical protein